MTLSRHVFCVAKRPAKPQQPQQPSKPSYRANPCQWNILSELVCVCLLLLGIDSVTKQFIIPFLFIHCVVIPFHWKPTLTTPNLPSSVTIDIVFIVIGKFIIGVCDDVDNH